MRRLPHCTLGVKGFRAARGGTAGSWLLLAAALVGCDSSPSPSAATPPPGATAGATTGPVTTAEPAGTPAVVELPPGAQFARGFTDVPGEARPVIAQFLTRAYFFGTSDGNPEALFRDGSTWKHAVIDDGAGYRPPAGASLQGGYFRVVGAAANDRAMVVLGVARSHDSDRPTGFDALPESLIWATRDAKTFERIDPRTLLPGRIGIRLTGIAATPSGFVVVGTSMSDADDRASDVVVLRSTDGSAWTETAHLGGAGTPFVRQLLADGDRVVIDATDQACDPTSLTYPIGLGNGLTRAWASSDGGATWQHLDLSPADPVLSQAAALIEGCPPKPKQGDLIALAQQVDTDGRLVGLAGGALIARSEDGTSLAVSRDFASWTQVALPGAIPIADGRRPLAQRIVRQYPFGDAISLVSLEVRTDLEGRPRSGGCQVRWWRSEDGGVTWTTGPWGRPMSTCAGAVWSFGQFLDRSVVLLGDVIKTSSTLDQVTFRTSTPGELIPWETCEPGPAVDCSFATINHPAGQANDWSGINLAGAAVVAAEMNGANLGEADLFAAFLSGSFEGADFGKVSASYLVLEGSFRQADFRDAGLFNAIIRADLTGALLDGAELFGAHFEPGAICPDGTAPTAGANDAKAACRL